jgi:hypothetical protein
LIGSIQHYVDRLYTALYIDRLYTTLYIDRLYTTLLKEIKVNYWKPTSF